MAQDIQTNVVLTADNSQYDQSMVASAGTTDQLGKSVDGLGAKLDKLTKSAGRKLIGVSAADTAALGATTLAYGAWEKQMSALNAQSAILYKNVTQQKQAFSGYSESVSNLRSEFNMATSEAADLTQTIVKLTGLPATGVNKLAQTFATMGTATNESATGLANSVLQLQKTMGTQPGRETERYANQLTQLAANTGSSATALADFAQQIAPVARQVGTSQTEVQGLSAAFAKAGQDGYQAMSFYTRMMNDISYAAESGSPRLNQFAELAGVMPEKFKDMSGLQQFSSILDSLQKSGPSAISTLNQLGYEGNRMSKVALTLSQQGGIMGAVGAARAADRDPTAMKRGSEAAMSNLYDSMSKLRIELTQTAEAFGKFWAGPASKFFDGLAKGAHMLSELASSPLGQFAAMIAGMTAPLVALAGALLLAAKAIGMFALARGLLTGAAASGFKETAALSMVEREAMAAQGMVPGVGAGRMTIGAQGANIARNPHWLQRGVYNTGSDLARFTGYRTGQAGSVLRTAGGLGLYGAGRAAEMIVQPQYAAASMRVPGFANTGGYNDITRRMPIFGSATARESFGMGPQGPLTRGWQSLRAGWQLGGGDISAAEAAGGRSVPGTVAGTGFWSSMRGAARSGWTGIKADQGGFLGRQGEPVSPTPADTKARIMGLGDPEKAAAAAAKNAKAVEASAASAERFAKTTGMAERGMGVFARSMISTTTQVASAGAGLARFGLGVGKQAFGLMGGNPLMAAGLAGFAAYKLGQSINSYKNTGTDSSTRFADPYLEAAGISTLPNAPYAVSAAVAAKSQTRRQAYQISPYEAAQARDPSRKLINSNLEGMDIKTAEAALSGMWKTGAQSPDFIANAAADLTAIGGPTEAAAALRRLRGGTAQTPYYLATEAAHPGKKGFGDTLFNRQSGELAQPKVDDLFSMIEETAAQVAATEGPTAGIRRRTEMLNQSMGAFQAGLDTSGRDIRGRWSGSENKEVQGVFYGGLLKELGVDKGRPLTDKELDKLGVPMTSAQGARAPKDTLEFVKRAIMSTENVGGQVAGYGSSGTLVPAGGGAPGGTPMYGLLGDQRATFTTGTGDAKAAILSDDDVKKLLSTAGVGEKQLATLDLNNRKAVYAAYTMATRNQTPQEVEAQKNATTLMSQQTWRTFGAGGVLAMPSVSKALGSKIGDANVTYQAVQDIVQGVASEGGSAAQGIGKTLDMLKTAGGVPQAGSDLFMAALQTQQQNMAMRQPYLSPAQNFAQAADVFSTIQGKPLAGDKGAEIKATSKQDFATSVQERYNFFKQQLYAQREFDVQRDRAEDAYNLQRTYQQEDFDIQRQRQEEQYNIGRSRAIRDFNQAQHESLVSFNIQRRRAEEDHDHQIKLMIEQQAMTYTNAYQRVAVQQTESTTWTAANIADQTDRIQEQTKNLATARKMGLTNQAIRMLGLNDPAHAQQLEQDIGEFRRNPAVIRALNKSVRTNVKAAGGLFTDESNKDWKEFNRAFNRSMNQNQSDFDRATRISRRHFNTQLGDMQDDYQLMLDNQQADYARMMSRQADAYNLSMKQSAEDLARSAKTIDGNFEDILTKATKRLSGHARAQAQATLSEFDNLNAKAGPKAVQLKQYYANVFGFDWTPPAPLGTGPGIDQNVTPPHQGGNQADGGVMPGYTPGRDVHNINVSGGEAIMRPEWARKVGEKNIDAMNHTAKYGGYGYAAGGVFKPINASTSGHVHDTGTGFPAIDFGASTGHPVYAVASGRISRSEDITGIEPRRTSYGKAQDGYRSYGRVIQLKTDIGPEVLYAHLSQRGVLQGTKVTGGEAIALSGDTGNSTGPHLHFGDSDGNPMEFVLNAGRGIGTISGAVPGKAAVRAAIKDILKKRYPGIEREMESGMGFQFPRNSISADINRLARRDIRRMRRKAEREGHLSGADIFGGIPQGPTGSNQKLVRRAMLDQGWHQWGSLYPLVMGESGFRNEAQNPDSSAYGMFQFIDSTWGTVGGKKTSDPWTQAVLGMRYIKSTYGDPDNAYAQWKSRDPHWYNEGSIFTGPKQIGVGEGGAEMVLPLNHRGTDFLGDLMRKHSPGLDGRGIGLGSSPMGGGISVMNYRIDKSTTFTGPITVQANDPNELIHKLQARNRLQALVRPRASGTAA